MIESMALGLVNNLHKKMVFIDNVKFKIDIHWGGIMW